MHGLQIWLTNDSVNSVEWSKNLNPKFYFSLVSQKVFRCPNMKEFSILNHVFIYLILGGGATKKGVTTPQCNGHNKAPL